LVRVDKLFTNIGKAMPRLVIKVKTEPKVTSLFFIYSLNVAKALVNILMPIAA
jgi:hypothetical protein